MRMAAFIASAPSPLETSTNYDGTRCHIVELINTDTSLDTELTTARSGNPMQKSPVATKRGEVPTGNSPASMKEMGDSTAALGTSMLSRTETLFDWKFAVAISNRPSPLKSCITTESGPLASTKKSTPG